MHGSVHKLIKAVNLIKLIVRELQYSKTNMMNFLFSVLRIKGLYMFQALLADPQEALHKWHLVYCMCVMSVGCTRIAVEHHSNSSAAN
jgi:hypothetical protein